MRPKGAYGVHWPGDTSLYVLYGSVPFVELQIYLAQLLDF